MKNDIIDIEKWDEAYSKIQESMFCRHINPKVYAKAPSMRTEKGTNGYWFREHRGGLKESLDTSIPCHDKLNSIVEYYKFINHPNPSPYTNIQIHPSPFFDTRLPDWWGDVEYTVIAFSNACGHNCIVTLGYCNFKE